jgi:hypothetical protein
MAMTAMAMAAMAITAMVKNLNYLRLKTDPKNKNYEHSH